MGVKGNSSEKLYAGIGVNLCFQFVYESHAAIAHRASCIVG